MNGNGSGVFEKYRRRLLAFIRNRVPESEAEDILQDVFLRFIQTEGDTTVAEASAWLYRVARNRIADFYRRRHPQLEMEDDILLREVSAVLNDDDPQHACLRALVWDELESALDELPGDQRTVFEYTELQGRSFSDLSAETGVPLNTLLSRKHYAVKHLRLRLREIYDALLE